MANILQRTRITPMRFALLALGTISLSGLTLPAMAGDDAPDAGAKNPSACRDVVNNKCLRKPNDGKSSQNQDTRNQDNAAAARAEAAKQAGVTADIAKQDASYQANKDKYGRENGVFGSGAGLSVDSKGYYHPYNPFPSKGGVKTTSGSGGSGGAAGHTGSRHTLQSPNRNAQTAAAPKAATPKSTTTDKATNTTTRDYRTGATAGPGSPPPAAASGSSTKATPEQLAAQSGTRDHRHK